MIRTVAALLFSALSLILFLFQIALVFGAPWGHLTLGGRYAGRLPGRMRGFAGFSALLIAAFAAIVLSRAGLVLPGCESAARVGIWFVVGYSALGIFLNAMSKSRCERILWIPVSVLMLACSCVIAIG